jgi:parallel beta-helix repeat protein
MKHTNFAFALVIALLVGLSVVFGGSAPAEAATTRVVNPGQSIQSAVDGSRTGDTVVVEAGTYVENVIISGKYVRLVGKPGATIRAANGSRAPLFITNVPFDGGGNRVVVTGFTITSGNSPSGHGGGITIFNDASPDINGNIIEGNRAAGYGGGISISMNSHPTIRNNEIRNNTAVAGGGGIFAVNNSSPVIYRNIITGNSTSGLSIPNGGSSGGAIYLENTSNPSLYSYPVVLDNTIISNSAEFAGGGIMLRIGVAAIMEDNTISRNSAAYGGGIHIETGGASSTVANNVIEGNFARANLKFGGSGFGGGISLYDRSNVTIRDNMIRGNSSSSGGAGVVSAESAVSRLDGNTITSNFVVPASSGQDGGGLYIANSTMIVTNNVFESNTAWVGSGVALLDGAKATIAFNTFVKNMANHPQGGALFVRDQAAVSADITNNLFASNNKVQLFEQRHRARLRNNLFYTPNGTQIYFASDTGIEVNTAAGLNSLSDSAGNIIANPGFANFAASDYSLTLGSGAVGVGETNPSTSVSDDIRGIIRTSMPHDIGAYEYEASPVAKQPVYRFWSTSKRGHFYTTSADERDQVASGYSPVEWRYESIAYDAFTTQVPGSIPLYRFYSAQKQGHFYTASVAEKDNTITQFSRLYVFEGIAYYVYPLITGIDSLEVYRFYSPNNQKHFYTASAAEKDQVRDLLKNVWSYEGPNFRVPR